MNPGIDTTQGASQVALVVKTRLPVQETKETWVQSLGREALLKRGMATHLYHRQRRLESYRPRRRQESDMTERLSMHTHNDTTAA